VDDDLRERRARLVRRQLSAASAVDAARSVVVLHATDPATVYLSVLARCPALGIDDVAREMYDERRLVRMMAMRRTLFVAPLDIAPVVHHAASVDVAATIRRRLLKELATGPTDPPLPADIGAWLEEAERAVEACVAADGPLSGSRIGDAVPALRTALLPRTTKAYDVRRTVTTQVLTMMGAEGRLVRGRPLGTWTSRQHTWEAAASWWPAGLPALDREDARARLVELYLRAFGPATETDVAWWTGWPLGVTRKALASLGTTDLDGGLVMPDDTGQVAVPEPRAALLPALDPTPMGWKQREWFLPADPTGLYDAYGNIGPTVWWGGEVVGAWSVRKDGRVTTRLLVDRGREVAAAVEAAAERLGDRLGGVVVVPSFRTPLERELSGG
jgi:hypothetical protein